MIKRGWVHSLCVGLCVGIVGCGGGNGGGASSTSLQSSMSSSSMVSSSLISSSSNSVSSLVASSASSDLVFSSVSSSSSSLVSSSLVASSVAASLQSSSSAASAWSDILPISAAGAGNPQVVMDADGNAMAIWLQQNSGSASESLWFNRYLAGSGWGTPQELESGHTAVDDPHMAIEPESGRVIVVWNQLTSPNGYDVWARYFDPASGWGTATTIDSALGTVSPARVAMDSSGNAVVVWAQVAVGRFSIWANVYAVADLGWGDAILIEDHNEIGGQDLNPQIAMLSSGEALAVWIQSDGTYRAIWTNRFVPGSGWGDASELVVDAGTDQSLDSPAIAADAAGNALLVWGQADFIESAFRSTIVSKRYSAGWQEENTLVSPRVESNLISKPTLVMNAQGDAIVAWARADQSIVASKVTGSRPWSAIDILKPADMVEVTSLPSLGMDASGNILVSWAQYTPDRNAQDVWINSYLSGSGWGSSSIHENYTDPAATPQVAVNHAGNAVLVWMQWIENEGTKIVARVLNTVNP